MPTHFIVHDKADTVGVVVVEDVKPGQKLEGWVMEGDATIHVAALDPVPLGHKIALKDIKNGDTIWPVVEYAQPRTFPIPAASAPGSSRAATMVAWALVATTTHDRTPARSPQTTPTGRTARP